MRGPRRGVDERDAPPSEIMTASDAVKAIDFVRRWMPYGGADSYEIFVTFGLTPAQFGQRLDRALSLSHHGSDGQFMEDRESFAREVDRLSGVGSRFGPGDA